MLSILWSTQIFWSHQAMHRETAAALAIASARSRAGNILVYASLFAPNSCGGIKLHADTMLVNKRGLRAEGQQRSPSRGMLC